MTVVEVPRLRQRESLDEAVERVLASPKAVRKILEGLSTQVASGRLPTHAQSTVAPGVAHLQEVWGGDRS